MIWLKCACQDINVSGDVLIFSGMRLRWRNWTCNCGGEGGNLYELRSQHSTLYKRGKFINKDLKERFPPTMAMSSFLVP